MRFFTEIISILPISSVTCSNSKTCVSQRVGHSPNVGFVGFENAYMYCENAAPLFCRTHSSIEFSLI